LSFGYKPVLLGKTAHIAMVFVQLVRSDSHFLFNCYHVDCLVEIEADAVVEN